MAGAKFSDFKPVTTIQDNMVVVGLDTNEPNLSLQNAKFTFRDLKEYIVTGVVKLDGFEWIGNPPTVETDGNTITVGAASAFYNDEVYEYAQAVFTIVLPEAGLQRISIVSVLPETGYVLTEGDDAQSPTQKPTPTGSQYISLLLINPDGAAEVPPEQFVRYINGVLIDFNGNEIELIKKAPITLTDAATVTFNGSFSENAVLYAPTLLTSLGFEQTKLGYDYSVRITEAGAKVLNLVPISGVQFKTLAGEVITELPLPDSDCEIIYKHVSASERTIVVADGDKYESASGEASTSILTFQNPFGHIRTNPLSGVQLFTKVEDVLGSTVVQPYTADGTSTLTFDFVHKVLNSDFASGQSLATGEYELYFSNRGSYVAVSIATIGPLPDVTAPGAPDNLLFSNITQTTATALWDAPVDTDVAGYNLYIDGVKQN